jgi:two-component system, OmpR family, sensor histidine kinase KdpD
MAETTTTQQKGRPSPKALLGLTANEGRGKLKVFLGMAPGVGKTYAMLAAAKVLKAEGLDVVVGVVETHGRSETAALLDGLEVLPRRTVSYRNRTLMEFDIDAAIARRPALLLVDEFAHSNAPGLVHPKRYQDVDGVLHAGIDVWTTLNIQHLESLNDVVERIAGIKVRETVPDRVLERADDIVVVDLPPEELIQRLKDGKVYLPDNARRAVGKFFQLGNLTALRELALRRTADRVDEQMISELRRQGIEGPWPTAERLLVCVGGDEMSEAVVRAAARMAAALKSDWIAIHLVKNDRETADRGAVRRAEKAMRLAHRLGATTVSLNAEALVPEVLAYARRNNVTQIVVGRARRGLVNALFDRSLSQALIDEADGIAVTVLAAKERRRSAWPPLPHIGPTWTGGIAAFAAVSVGVVVGKFIERFTSLPNLSMVFLLAVLVCALRFGLFSSVAAAALSFVAYNFFFINPRYTLTIASPHEFFALLVFLAVAVVTGGLAARLREQASATRERAEATQALYEFSRKLAGAPKIDDVLWLLVAQSAAVVKGKAIILLERDGDLAIESAWPPEDALSTADWAAARWAKEKREAAGRLTSTLPSAAYQFRPLISSAGTIGVLGVAPADEEDALPNATASALQSFADQAAIAIERTQLVQRAAKAATEAESERLRGALLSSISHDLRTPLASILGSATSLRQLGERMPKSDRADLLSTIEEEASRLSSFVSNLLDMTRLEAGALDIRRDWVDAGDALRGAVARIGKIFPQRSVTVSFADSLPLVRGDAALLEQVFFNLLDNAHKFSPPQSITRIAACLDPNGDMRITVTDDGIGIPQESLGKVFGKFYRVTGGDGRAPGTGLGLSIAAALVSAMRGTITATSPAESGKGTEIAVVLPTRDGAVDPDNVPRSTQ